MSSKSRRDFWQAVGFFALTAISLALAVVGYIAAWREALRSRRWDFLLISHLVIGYYAGVVAVAVAGLWHPRYRTPYLPFLMMYSGWGLMAAGDGIRQRIQTAREPQTQMPVQ